MLGATSLVNNFSNFSGIPSGGLSVEQLGKTLTATRQTAPMDTVSISSSANILQQFLNTEMQGNGSPTDIGDLDLIGLAQLKQRGEMLAGMLQLKMKNFESSLVSNIQGAGLSMQDMNIKNGDEGLLLMGDMPNKEAMQSVLGEMQGEFTEIARLAEVLNLLQQMGPENIISALSSAAAQYAQQSLPDKPSVKRPETDFVMHLMQSGASFSFE